MIQKTPFTYQGTDQDVRILEAHLKKILALIPLSLPHPISILNLACGRADETGALAAAFSPAKINFYLGLDLRSCAIEEARKRWELPAGEIQFREGNAAMLGRERGLPPFDVVFIRHQNYWHDPMVWEGILEEALAALKQGGIFIATSYFDLEHQLFMASMKTRSFTPLVNLRNPQSRILPDALGKSVDRWIALFLKP